MLDLKSKSDSWRLTYTCKYWFPTLSSYISIDISDFILSSCSFNKNLLHNIYPSLTYNVQNPKNICVVKKVKTYQAAYLKHPRNTREGSEYVTEVSGVDSE